LDAATAAVGVVNGPEDDTLDWHAIDWRRVEADVRRLRQRIFTASQAGDLKKVRNLQKLMLRSRSNTLVSVRRVTERNAGRLTAGVVLTPEAKARLADRVQQNAEPFKALPVRRVYIPKRGSSGKRSPLGIPVILDRCHQARVVNALEPEWERPGSSRSPTGSGRATRGRAWSTAGGSTALRRTATAADVRRFRSASASPRARLPHAAPFVVLATYPRVAPQIRPKGVRSGAMNCHWLPLVLVAGCLLWPRQP
jgi:N-terminal domain of reverse transcriptase